MLLSLLLTLILQTPVLTEDSPALRISFDDFKKLYDAGEVVVYDTRGLAAYREGHIAGALPLPLDDVEAKIPELQKETRTIVLYCS